MGIRCGEMNTTFTRPYTPEVEAVSGPGADFWRQRQYAKSTLTADEALMVESASWCGIADLIRSKIEKRRAQSRKGSQNLE